MYIEYIFIENLIVNILLIIQTHIFTNTKIKKLKIIIISIFLSLILTVFKIINMNYILNILTISLSVYYIFKQNSKNLITILKYQIYFYFISVLYIGSIIYTVLIFNLNISSVITRLSIYLINQGLIYIVYKFVWKIWINKIKNEPLMYKLKLNNINFNVFLDTGNNLSYLDYDVILIDRKKYLKKIRKKQNIFSGYNYFDVPIITTNGSKVEKGVEYKNLKLKKERIEYDIKKSIVVFIDINEYDGLLSYNTYLNKLRGVKL